MSQINYPYDGAQLFDNSGNRINPAKEDGNLASIKTDADSLPGIKTDLDEIAVDTDNLAGIKTDLDGIKAQTDKLTFSGSQLDVTSSVGFATRQDTYTVPGNGTTVDAHTAPLKAFAVQIKGTGAAATAWDIVLEGSLDGVNFSTVLEHVTAVGDGQVMWTGELDSPCLYFRSRLVSVTLGSATNIVVTILGD